MSAPLASGSFSQPLVSRERHVVVIGAGIVGASTAWHLAKKGFRVTLLDRDTPRAIADGASGGNAGLLSIGHYPLTRPGVSMRGLKWMFSRTAPLYIKPRLDRELVSWLWNFHLHCNKRHLDRCMEVLCAMGWQTLEVLEGMLEQESISCDYARDGWLDVVMKPENMAHAEAEAKSLEKFGYTWERIEGNELRRRDPCFRGEVAGAIHMKDSAHCAPNDVIAGLVRALPRHGVELRFDAEVRAFRQTRSGIGGGQFRIFKFRTMHAGSERDTSQAREQDSRIFPAGRWLRKTSLDEIPQFLNVLLGEMSVVGPRPHLPEHNSQWQRLLTAYNVRTVVKPGVTGLAQVRGMRGEAKTDEDVVRRIGADLEYIENYSPLVDLAIVIQTAWQVLFPKKTAY